MSGLLGPTWIVKVFCVHPIDFTPYPVGEVRFTCDRPEAERLAREMCSRQHQSSGCHYTIRKSRK